MKEKYNSQEPCTTFLAARRLTQNDPLPPDIPHGDFTRDFGRPAFGNISDLHSRKPSNAQLSVYIQRQELSKLLDAETRVQTLFFLADPTLRFIAGNRAVRTCRTIPLAYWVRMLIKESEGYRTTAGTSQSRCMLFIVKLP